jgi:hypothetical protein
MMESSVSVCPVPAEQQPLNEYEELKSSGFFRTGTLDQREYIKKLAWIWGLSWLIAGPVAAASFAPGKYTAQFILSGMAGASVGVTLAVVRLYLGWSYVRDRLMRPTIFYEESGWYDGQTWTKPPELLMRDHLIVTYQIQPILQRLQRTSGFLALLLLADAIVWSFL